MKNATHNRISRLLPLVILVGLAFTASTVSAGVNTWTTNGPEGGTVRALFDLSHPNGGPFPSDRFTVRDRSHLTGLRVNLPKPDCAERPSDCDAINVINTLDGFNLQPRRA